MYTESVEWLIGVDEAGRGPLAGPVAVGVFAVSCKFDHAMLSGIRDSKKLSERQREQWFSDLKALSHVRWAVSQMSASSIDQHGIVRAVETALVRSLRKLALDPVRCSVLLDGGLHAPRHFQHQKTIVHGDMLEPIISAAAICAKVTRDRYMVRQARQYPEYGFEAHKGYGTRAHRDAITEYGLSSLHRKTYCHVHQ